MKCLKEKFLELKNNISKEKGFTLLELIAVIAILGIITAISFTVFSTQGEKARISAHQTNVITIEQASQRYSMEKGFKTGVGATNEDFAYIDETHNLVKEGYLKDVPKNPWKDTNKPQNTFKYIITKDNRGIFFAYLAEVPNTGATITNIVVVNGDDTSVKTPTALNIVPTTTEPTISSPQTERYYRGR